MRQDRAYHGFKMGVPYSKKSSTLVGDAHPNSRLTEEIVRAIRADKTLNIVEKAKELGVSTATINLARSGKTWKHVK